MSRAITVLVCALGGEGGGVLAKWLVDVAHRAGYAAQSTSIPGVAQRTGATTYYLEVFPVPIAQLDGRRPVFGLYPVPGALDLLVSSELLETVRQIGNGLVDPRRTRVITSTGRTWTTQERMQQGDGRYDPQRLTDAVRRFSRGPHLLDMATLTRDSGTVVSAVMLGALAASGVLPMPREAYEAVVQAGGLAATASLRGFGRGFDAVTGVRDPSAVVQPVMADVPASAARGAASNANDPDATGAVAPPPLPAAVANRFPSSLHDLLALGCARLLEYQDQAYADLYVERLARVLAAERASDPSSEHGCATTREATRWLALWMAFDDIVRVAHLKSRAARSDRVRREVRAADGDIVRVFDHFKPGAAEFAGMLAPQPAQALMRWERRRVAAGKAPWALPLKLGAHTVSGMATLRMLGSLKGLRRRGQRFGLEQALIERWLAAVCDSTRPGEGGWQVGHELARCARLIKGYGTTNERGKATLLHLLEHVAVGGGFESNRDRAHAIAQARDAALADEAGQALNDTLARHGIAPRAPLEQPIRWMSRPAVQAARRR